MAAESSVPKISFTDTGVTLPADSELLAGVFADWNNAMGGNLNPALESPQGQLISSQTAIVSDKNTQFAKYISLIDPDTSSGIMQDGIARLYFLTRRPATSTVAQVQCSGLAGVVIPVGALVRDAYKNVYSCTQAGTIAANGVITLPFAAQTPGPIQCPPGSITGAPYRAIAGWDRATNIAAAIPGTLVESPREFEFRRKQSVALNGSGYLAAIYANVFNLPGVTDVYATENKEASPVQVGSSNYQMVEHSIYVAVVGGIAADIARAIWSRKDGGCNYNGNTSVNVMDQSGYQVPYPTYPVTFNVPASLPVRFAVQLVDSPLLPADIVTRVQTAIVNAFAGLDGGQRARIGATIFASRFYAPVIMSSPGVSILSLLLGPDSPTLATWTAGIDQAPVVSANDITVTLV